jgi:hypothetical protein
MAFDVLPPTGPVHVVEEDHRTSIVLFANPRPSHVKYRDTAVAESLGMITQPTILHETGGGTGSDQAIAGLIVGLKESLESAMLRSEAVDSEGNKQFSRLPDHLKSLLYHLGHVPGADEPTALSTNETNFMAQHTLASAMSLLEKALHNTYGLSVMVQQGTSVQALRTGLLLWDDPSNPGNHSIFQYYSPTSGDSTDAAADL